MSDVRPGTGRLAHAPTDHPPVKAAKIGVLIANLGTPDGTDYWSMRRYLNEFLSDKRVVDLPDWKWQPILQGIILTIRPSKSGANYRKIWNHETDESPLLTITRAQTRAIEKAMTETHGDGGDGGFLHALRQSFDRIEGAGHGRGRVREDPVLPALPALRRRHLGHGERRLLPRADEGEAPAGGAHGGGIFRPPVLYRRRSPVRSAGPGMRPRSSRRSW